MPAIYSVSDTGVTCLAQCPLLADLNVSYCHQVSYVYVVWILLHVQCVCVCVCVHVCACVDVCACE